MGYLFSNNAHYLTTSVSLARNQTIATALGEKPVYAGLFSVFKGKTVVGWGRKKSGLRAKYLAQKYRCKLLLMEDGFLRSFGRNDAPISYVLDQLGIYYDATQPSGLEYAIANPDNNYSASYARLIQAAWQQWEVSKYNGYPDYHDGQQDPYILLVDQTAGDASIAYGLANAQSFQQMLDDALHTFPHHRLLIKTHPDVMTRRKKGHFDFASLQKHPRVQIIAQAVHPVRLLRDAYAVYTVTSQMGFEALLWDKQVYCYGMPFYAGWGLTEDNMNNPDRRYSISLDQLVYAALAQYPIYIEPQTAQRCDVMQAIQTLGKMRLT
jgi:capsular polysaccharide export protein